MSEAPRVATSVRVLVLEDNPDDAELAILELERAGFAPDWRRVQTEAEFLAALREPCDLILADYNLPDFDALTALTRVGATGLDVPFIIVSGSIGEDAAVTAMQRGAADYVLKDRLARLGQAARRALEQRRDRQERVHAEEQLRHLALYDVLTDLPNRVLFSDRLHHAVAMASRRHGSFCLLMFDLDRFKEVNDSLGHHAGDQLLKQVGARLSEELRESDTVARLGGDEFAVISGFDIEIDNAVLTAKKILKALAKPFSLGETAVKISASVGIARYPDHGADADTLVRHADIAMYAAKADPGGYALYAPSQDSNMLERLGLVHDLYSALPHGELLVHFQPKVDIATSRVVGAEALVRWRHPERGLLYPESFISFVEKSDLIGPLLGEVLEESLRAAATWRRGGLEVGVSVNVSAANLYDPELPSMVKAALERHQLPPHTLTAEITETAIMATHTESTVRRLSALGVRISIDDFGTGYSSLRYLKTLPVDEIKIDQSFVTDMARDASDAAIVKCIVDLAKTLDLRVVAEGVETRTIAGMLEGLGCDEIQGYHIAPAMPADEVIGWLSAGDETLTPATPA
ncbi:MAG TPA: EAL domain-containing protein [Candidatus Dormibacteraeota bacterium]